MRNFSRLVAALVLATTSFSAFCGKPHVHVDPVAGENPATIVKEFCLGKGRGLIHFDGYDQAKFKPLTVQKIVASPGKHAISVIFRAPGSRFDLEQEGSRTLEYEFAPGGSYLVRYRRTDPDHYVAWIEPLDLAQAQSPNPICLEPPFEDSRYWQ